MPLAEAERLILLGIGLNSLVGHRRNRRAAAYPFGEVAC
jgi:hypothetical protein